MSRSVAKTRTKRLCGCKGRRGGEEARETNVTAFEVVNDDE